MFLGSKSMQLMGLAERRTNVNEEVDLKERERQKVEEEIEEEKERRVINGCNCNRCC